MVVLERWRRLRWGLVPLGLLAVAVWLFPGRRLGIALTLATGIGRGALQARIDDLEAKAIGRVALAPDDRQLLTDFYRSLATGGKLSVVVRQTGYMMEHYLDGSGGEYRLDPVIFTENQKVRAQARALRDRVQSSGCSTRERLSSPTFYMPDRSNVDSVFGLYHGTLHLKTSREADGRCRLHFRAEVPWVWPSYRALAEKYGDPHAESFPLPSLRSLVLGADQALYVDNGLGHYLEEVGLARSLLAFAEWSESPP